MLQNNTWEDKTQSWYLVETRPKEGLLSFHNLQRDLICVPDRAQCLLSPVWRGGPSAGFTTFWQLLNYTSNAMSLLKLLEYHPLLPPGLFTTKARTLTYIPVCSEAFLHLSLKSSSEGCPGGSDSKGSACNVGDLGLIPGLGRSPGGGHRNPFHYTYLENPKDRKKSLAGYSP